MVLNIIWFEFNGIVIGCMIDDLVPAKESILFVLTELSNIFICSIPLKLHVKGNWIIFELDKYVVLLLKPKTWKHVDIALIENVWEYEIVSLLVIEFTEIKKPVGSIDSNVDINVFTL
jgi:hypothetical protein